MPTEVADSGHGVVVLKTVDDSTGADVTIHIERSYKGGDRLFIDIELAGDRGSVWLDREATELFVASVMSVYSRLEESNG